MTEELKNKLIMSIVAGLLVGGSTVYENKHTHTAIWTETGDHFQDLLNLEKTNAMRITELERKQKENK